MGVSLALYQKFNKFIGDNPNIKSVLELGDQEVYFGGSYGQKFRYNFNNYDWTTIDLHQVNGVRVKDLSVIDNDFGKWDLVTDFGTSEHVEYEVGQYNCWVNTHNWTKVGGFQVHEIPEYGSWKNHCRYFYTSEFFYEFEKIGYKVIDFEKINYSDQGNLLYCVLEKVEESDFFSYDEFFNLVKFDNISLGAVAQMNNPKKLI